MVLPTEGLLNGVSEVFRAPSRPVIRSRKLENRSYLKFVFPQGKDSTPLIFDLPFYENINISEAGKASLVRYSPIGRPGDMFTSTGSRSRKLSLEFSITLPHIQFDAIAINLDRFLSNPIAESKSILISRFLNKDKTPTSTLPSRQTSDASSKIYLRIKDAILRYFGFDDLFSGTLSTISFGSLFSSTTAHAVIYWWISLIRASVMTNSKNPLLGPPIIRLSHGLLYNNIPCVATDYSISIDESAGYELKTMMPRKLDISLNLEEIRNSSFDDFVPGESINQDNVAGWEAILEHGTTDPGRLGDE